MELLNSKAEDYIRNTIVANMPKIKVNSGTLRYNFRCQYNAVNDALNAGEDRIAMCFIIDGNMPIIHFINVDSEGNYTDNTLGRWSETCCYYFVRYIERDSFFNIDDIFSAYRKELRAKIPFFVRLFSDYAG